jgi:hypothetical protein
LATKANLRQHHFFVKTLEKTMKVTVSTTKTKTPKPAIVEYASDEISEIASYFEGALVDNDGKRTNERKFIIEIFRIPSGFRYNIHPLSLLG